MLRNFLSLNRLFFSQSKFIKRRDWYNSLQIKLVGKVNGVWMQKQLIELQKLQRSNRTNAIWVYLDSGNLENVSLLVNQLGYKIHHGIDNRIALYKWLQQKQDLVPLYSSVYTSCGSVVINNDHILLVEQSNKGPRKGMFGIPGGRADIGQFLETTAERQLFEQTGIVAKFQHFIYFRQMENTVFGANDIYFVCLMKAEQQSLNKLKLCQRQLASSEWVHLSKLGQFVSKKSSGTQKQVGIYINELYNKGYKFQTDNQQNYPVLSDQKIFDKGKDGIRRKFKNHRLINIVNQDRKSQVT